MIATQLALLIATLIAPVLPAHGTVLGNGPDGTLIVRTDPITGMLPAQTRAYRVSPHLWAKSGVGVDGFIDRSTGPWRLYDASIAARFTPGLPQSGKVVAVDLGSALPHTRLVDQRGRFVDLASSFAGKVLLVSFVFTRCPDKDECPLVSSKFSYLQAHLDPRRFHLVEITLDPVYDSPWILEGYARTFGARPQSWSILTGQPHEIADLLDRFGISSLQVGDAQFIHNDKVFLTQPDGRVAQIVQSTEFSAPAMVAQAQHLAGMASNPLGRWQLSLIAGVTALCGGSQYAGIVLLETVFFLIVAAIAFLALGWIARKLWSNA